MPSTRKQKRCDGNVYTIDHRKSREMDILSHYGNMDVMISEGNTNSIERELDSIFNGPEGH